MRTGDLFAPPRLVKDLSGCRFYHAMDLPRSGFVAGDWDLRGKFERYTGGLQFSGKTVLDVGTASGFLTFEAERQGAEVVSVDARSARDVNRVPVPGSLFVTDHRQWELETDRLLDQLKSSYWRAHSEFGSRAKVYYGSVYDLPAELGQFDVVIVGQILVHVSDVVRALSSIAPRSGETLIVAEGVIDTDQPLSRFLGRADRPDRNRAFWHHSTGLYRELMAMFGFELKSNETHAYSCHVPGAAPAIDITTLVFRRA